MLRFPLPIINPLAKIVVVLSQALGAWHGMGISIPHLGGGGGYGNYGLMRCMAWYEEWDEVSYFMLDPSGKYISKFIIFKLINDIFILAYHI